MILILDFDRVLFDVEYFYTVLTEGATKDEINSAITDLPLSSFLYSDTVAFLEKYKKYTLILLTFGDLYFQKIKVERSGIVPYFKDIYYTGDKMKAPYIKKMYDLEKSNDNLVFVDDEMVHLKETKELCPEMLLIRMRRLGAKASSLDQEDFLEARDLTDLDRLLTSRL